MKLNGQIATVKLIKSTKGCLNGASCIVSRIALQSSLLTGSTDSLKLLLEAGVDPLSNPDDNQVSPLITAMSKNCTESVKLLIKYGADVNEKSFYRKDFDQKWFSTRSAEQ